MSQEQSVPCATSPKLLGLLPCSGACNVGLMTNRAVVDQVIQRPGEIAFVCALGLPLGIQGIINNGKKAEVYLALNGCDVRCASKALESAEIPMDMEIVVTKDLGIAKNKNFVDMSEYPKVQAAVEAKLDELRRFERE